MYILNNNWWNANLNTYASVYYGVYTLAIIVAVGIIAATDKTEKIADAKQLQSEIAALQKTIADMQLEAKKLQSEIAQQNTAIAENKNTQSEMKGLQFEFEIEKQKNQRLQSEIADSQKNVTELQKTIVRQLHENIDFDELWDEMKANLKKAIHERDALLKEIADSKKNATELQPEIAQEEKLQSEIADIKKMQPEIAQEEKLQSKIADDKKQTVKDILIAQALQLKSQGMSNKDIAIKLNVQEYNICRWLQKHAIIQTPAG